jgi:hypothetical protein
MVKTDFLQAARVEGRTHHFPADRVHFTWDVAHEPVLTIASSDTVVLQTRDVSDNQISPESTAADLDLDWNRVYPLARPIAVEVPSPVTRSRSRSSTCTRSAGAGRRFSPAWGCFRTTSRIRT